ncbi:MAG TPA: helix-turn-helix domain-containing protein [bacterium]|nr:helix-turn-helix domain-containing protein [bacterium]
MIRNEHQYKVTKGQISRLEKAMEAGRSVRERISPKAYQAMMAGIQSQIDELRAEMKEFEDLHGVSLTPLHSIRDLPDILVKARIAKGYTQKDLAKKLDVKPQQVQKYEATGYQSAKLERIIEVMDALEVDLRTEVRLGDKTGSGRQQDHA